MFINKISLSIKPKAPVWHKLKFGGMQNLKTDATKYFNWINLAHFSDKYSSVKIILE